MGDFERDENRDATGHQQPPSISRCTDWYAEGQERVVEVDGVRVVIRFVARKGRRARIAITAPPGAAFLALKPNESVRLADQSS
jgi:hypothetical protein